MPQTGPSEPERQLRQARSELESELRAGTTFRVEDLFARHPAIAADQEAILELLYTEYVIRHELGEEPEMAEWYARFPALRGELEAVFEVHRELVEAEAEADPWRSTVEPAVDEMSQVPGRIAGYEILDEINRGGMGVVLRARQVRLNRIVAVKLILGGARAGDKQLARFQVEVEAVARLDHPNIVRIFEVGDDRGRPFFAMEYMEGGSLADRMVGVPWPTRRSAELVAVLARAVHHAHERGIVHRDIKPANVLLAGEKSAPEARIGLAAHGSSDREFAAGVKIADFGLAKSLEGSDLGPTQTGDFVGTPAYMAPEQAEGRSRAVGPLADVWALGVMLYELFTGRSPFLGDSAVETLKQVREHDPVPPRQIRAALPRDLETICLKCLGKMPAERYTSAAGLADDLERWLRGEPILARPVGAIGRARRWCGRNPVLAGLYCLVATLFLTAAVLAAVAVRNLQDSREQAERLARQEREARLKVSLEQLEERRRVIQLRTADAMHRADEGDLTGAAVLLSEVLRNDPDPSAHEPHRIRLGTLIRGCPVPKRIVWGRFGEEDGVRLSADGSTLAEFRASKPPVIHDLTSSRRSSTIPLQVAKGPVRWELNRRGDVLAAVANNRIQLWDITTGRQLPVPLQPGRATLPPPFAPNGSRFLATTLVPRLNGVRLPVYTASPFRVFEAEGSTVGGPLGQESKVMACRLAPDGLRLATADGDGLIHLWDLVNGERLGPPIRFEARVNALAFHPNGLRLAAVGNDATGQVWDIASRRPVGYRMVHNQIVEAVEFDPSGERIATVAGLNAAVHVWDAREGRVGRVRGEPLRHDDRLKAMAFRSDGRMLVTTTANGTVRVWETDTGRALSPAMIQHGVAQFSDDGRLVLVQGAEALSVWSAPKASSAHRLERAVVVLIWSPDSKTYYASDLHALAMCNASGGRLLRQIQFSERASRVELSPDGRRLLVQTQSTIRLLSAATLAAIGDEIRTDSPINGRSFLRDGRLAVVSANGAITFWNAEDGHKVGSTLSNGYAADGVQVGMQADTMLVLGRVSQLWDLESGRLTASFPSHPDSRRVQLTPDGLGILSIRGHSRMQLYNAPDGKPIGPEFDVADWTLVPTISPDGTRLASFRRFDRSFQVWDLRTGQRIGPPLQQRGQITGVFFTPDGRSLLTTCPDGLARLWEIETGLPLSPELWHGSVVITAALDGRGERLVTGGLDGTSHVWDLSPDPRPVDELIGLSRLLARRRIDDEGHLVSLTRAENEAVWSSFNPRSGAGTGAP